MDITNPLLGRNWVVDADGHWMSASAYRLAEMLQDYDPYLFLAQIPPIDRRDGDNNPWGILHELPGKEPYILATYTDAELENPTEILARVFAGDLRKNNPVIAIERYEAAEAAMRLKAREEEIEEYKDFARHMWNSPKSRYTHNGRVYE
jgi:hypothetical protein